ncbi:mitochondrial inner membrane protease-like protein ATP23 [Zopfia rhizophila CBS 207.26]|uniref:Mitochondrial inner membrane protease ATP23 n=1 Tax=Zopfia rhizophila CBS 207.26 TaxID=1314779 RepID=A0A6A6DQ90_9PEZI|nr:mitochondrial inner membrane protease-like protein ATP23 [Zopfia rhizophila CBS 207.26]
MSLSEQRTGGASTTQTDAKPSVNSQKLDPVYYTWSNFFSIALGRMTGDRNVNLEQKYFQEMDDIKEEDVCKKCEEQRDFMLQYSPVVRFMRDEVAKLDGNLNSQNIVCRRCTREQSGGFSPNHGILLCANHFRNRGHLEDTLAHEMIHAWDALKWKIDDNNLRHQACMEIRASTLSGECRFAREFFSRNQWTITEHLQKCVRRRATLSMMARPGVKDDVHAAKIVNEVWESCFNDTRPFDEIYR